MLAYLNAEGNAKSEIVEHTTDLRWKSDVINKFDLCHDLVEAHEDLDLVPQCERVDHEMSQFLQPISKARRSIRGDLQWHGGRKYDGA